MSCPHWFFATIVLGQTAGDVMYAPKNLLPLAAQQVRISRLCPDPPYLPARSQAAFAPGPKTRRIVASNSSPGIP